MSGTSRSSLRVLALLVGTLAAPGAGGAQLISLRTVPVAAGDQYLLAPSQTLGMAGVTLALTDSLADPFANPASAARTSTFFTAPTRYDVRSRYGAARTVPVGALIDGERWFGGGLAALQELRVGRRFQNQAPALDRTSEVALPPADALVARQPRNRYVHAILGRRSDSGALTVGLGLAVADLNGVDGTEQVFVNAWQIDQYGHVLDLRLGVAASLAGGSTLEGVLVHNRLSMTHEITAVTGWLLTDSARNRFTPSVSTEANLDYTRTWGAHLEYRRPIEGSPWTVGTSLTANRKAHPRIPTYDLTRAVPPIPRDPGDSWAYAAGVGLGYARGPTRFGVDVVYEPAFSDTWAEAEADVTAADGSVIPAGGKTVENRFDFANASARAGVAHEVDGLAFQLGVAMKSVDYRLRQENHLTGLPRTQREDWLEWTPTWGVRWAGEGWELAYAGSASSASHFPLPDFGEGQNLFTGALQDTDLLAPPATALEIPDATVVTHRLQLSVPIR